MEKKSPINPNVSPSNDGGTYTFLYWDDSNLDDIIKFNSLDDTHVPSEICSGSNTITK